MEEKKELHKIRNSRLARRAKSFKEDLLIRLNQIRSPSSTRAGSPNKGSKNKIKLGGCDLPEDKDVDSIMHSAQLLTSSLRYFQDVVQKNSLEMLPGSATVVLENVIMIHSTLRKALVDEQSSLMQSATNQVYQSLANLIRWSDCILLQDKVTEKDDVSDIVQAVQDAATALVQLSLDKLQNKDVQLQNQNKHSINYNSSLESPHTNSLPDIPLTSREKEILQQTQFQGPHSHAPHIHHSASSDSILDNGSLCADALQSAPPKPPLPHTRETIFTKSSCESSLHRKAFVHCAPPLPPKKKPSTQPQLDRIPCTSDLALNQSSCFLSTSTCLYSDRTSPHSQSPETSTPLSKSSASSLDSNLNCSLDDLSFGPQKSSCTSDNSFNSCFGCTISNSSQTYSCDLISSTRTESKLSSVILRTEKFHSTSSQVNCVSISSSPETNNLSKPEVLPPALPVKLRTTKTRTLSQYDNVPHSQDSNVDESMNFNEDCISPIRLAAQDPQFWLDNTHAPSCPHHKTLETNDLRDPPPLPPKKKTIMAYMQMFGSYSQPSETEFLQHSSHTYNVIQAHWMQMELSFLHQHSFSNSFTYSTEKSVFPSVSSDIDGSDKGNEEETFNETVPPALPPKKSRVSSQDLTHLESPLSSGSNFLENMPIFPVLCDRNISDINMDENAPGEVEDMGALEELDAAHYIACKNPGEEGPDIRGGTIDSLLVQATKATKNDFLYQEAFLTTYRTFITPADLTTKLLYRYTKFIHMSDVRQRAARNAFSLLVRVVDDMCMADLQISTLNILMDFVFNLVNHGELMLARVLRKKIVEKCESRKKTMLSTPVLLPSMAVSTRQASLLEFKSESLAEQMTLLDANLFQKIEIPEVLLWAKEQKEELSPNLTKFTEHFNKMSYWARSRILEQEEAKDRERYVVKYIKIMKYLRKLNNFNSYLAILSALDSAPIRRLEWQRNLAEGLKEYCALIDSSSSFRAYRHALAETGPPCIPYIGLILQDLTFVHIGNNDWLSEGVVNFSKRWQQFNILDNMRRFKNCHYPFRRNDQIISFFNNFDDYLCEEAMWQISETIKPRGGKKKNLEHL